MTCRFSTRAQEDQREAQVSSMLLSGTFTRPGKSVMIFTDQIMSFAH